MPCLVSMSYCVPLSAPHTFFMETDHSAVIAQLFGNSCLHEIHPSKLLVGGLSSQQAYRTATQLSIHKGISLLNPSSSQLWTLSRRHCEIVSCHINVDSCTHMMVISGYWVGPDIDDGWGFIEAFIIPIT